MTGKITLGALRYTFATPAYENGFEKRCVWIFDLNERELDPAVREIIY